RSPERRAGLRAQQYLGRPLSRPGDQLPGSGCDDVTTHRLRLDPVTTHRLRLDDVTTHRLRLDDVTTHRLRLDPVTPHRLRLDPVTTHRPRFATIRGPAANVLGLLDLLAGPGRLSRIGDFPSTDDHEGLLPKAGS